MPTKTQIFDAFTGISAWDHHAIVQFILEHSSGASRKDVCESIDYALKNKPSFGGFVLTLWENRELLGVLVCNRTGMTGYSPRNVFVFVAVPTSDARSEQILRELLDEGVKRADGDIALHLEPGHPALPLYEDRGFQPQYLELRFQKNPSTVQAH